MSGNVSIDPLYWGAIGQYLGGSGAAGYEQDWLFDQASTDYNLTDGDLFLGNMASALGQQDVAIQYCSASTRHFLQSAMYNNVTTIRASGGDPLRQHPLDQLSVRFATGQRGGRVALHGRIPERRNQQPRCWKDRLLY